LVNQLHEFDNQIQTIRSRQKKAASKAWRTIRTRRRLESAKDLTKIDTYLTLKKLNMIVHPELTSKKGDASSVESSFKNRIVTLFHKTPPEIACGKFWELRWAYGCPLDCNYCYLRGTMRGKMKPVPVRLDSTLNALEDAFKTITEPSIFNSGELSDSLMFPSIMEKIIDKFEEQKIHKIALLSKMGMKHSEFLFRRLRKQTICGWSINPPEVAKVWEKAAAPPKERISAAIRAKEVGYDVRIRIDPIFPIENWKNFYGKLLESVVTNIYPTRIILGTPRGLWKTIKYAKDAGIEMSWASFFREDSGWGKKLSFKQRSELYEFCFDSLNKLGYPKSNVGLCKETTEMWRNLGLPYEPLTCNCYGKNAL
jgi:spore photoproduct lyase